MNVNQIIAKVLAGEASQEELQALDVWKKEAQDNVKAIKEINAINASFEDIGSYKEFGAEKAWSQMEDLMQSDPLMIPENKSKPLENQAKVVPWYKIAMAASFLGLACLLGWQLSGNDPLTSEPTAYISELNVIDASLEDGSTVKLDKHSNLTAMSARAVNLEGRAFFQIAKSETEKFTIDLPQGSITVLGTEFVVDTRESKVRVYVTEGKVMYIHNNRKIILEAGDHLILDDGDINKFKSDGEDMISWYASRLSFRNESLAKVVEALNKNYDQQIVIDLKKSHAECLVNTTFKNESIQDILNELSLTLGLKYHTIDGVIHIVESNC